MHHSVVAGEELALTFIEQLQSGDSSLAPACREHINPTAAKLNFVCSGMFCLQSLCVECWILLVITVGEIQAKVKFSQFTQLCWSFCTCHFQPKALFCCNNVIPKRNHCQVSALFFANLPTVQNFMKRSHL